MEPEARTLEVIRLGHPVLRTVAEPVPDEWFASGRLRTLSSDMVKTMLDEQGVGLAAPQVAEALRLFVYWVPEIGEQPEIPPQVVVNPVIRAIGDEVEQGWEGCLSIPGLRGQVPRNRRIKVRGHDVDGAPVSFTADGFHARVIQHELDHLDGVVFLDRMTSMASLAFDDEWERFNLDAGD